jgi:hypothetical protein
MNNTDKTAIVNALRKKKRKKIVNNPAGRPSSITNDRVLQLKELVLKGLDIKEALHSVGISKTAYYNYCENNKGFKDLMVSLKGLELKTGAKLVIHDKIVIDKDVNTAKWVLEKLDEDYKQDKQGNINIFGNVSINVLEEAYNRAVNLQNGQYSSSIDVEFETVED